MFFVSAVIAGMERFSFKGVAANLVTYLTEVAKMSNSSAAKTVNSWVGFTSIMPILVAPLADSYWDSYATILVFSFLYLLVSPPFRLVRSFRSFQLDSDLVLCTRSAHLSYVLVSH